MTLLKSPEDVVAGASDRLAAPVLRLQQQGEASHREVKLAAGKCTLGSSPQCQVQLASPEVRPLQCLITLQDDAAQVTRWAAGVLLNGKEFSKAPLSNGDRLTIGSWEIEFVTGQAPVAPGVEADAAAVEPQAEVPAHEPTIEAADASEEFTSVASAEARLETLESAASDLAQVEKLPGEPEVALATAAECLQTFEDKLVLHLWTANHTARRRAKSLLNGIRAARFHADAMAADLSAMETELDLARAAYDCRLGNDERTQHELVECQSQRELVIEPLQAEIAGLRSQLTSAQQAVEQKTAAFAKAVAECEALRSAVADTSATIALEARIEELEAELAAQTEKFVLLADELDAAREQQQRISDSHRVVEERPAAIETPVSEPAAEVPIGSAPAAANLWQNVTPLAAAEDVELSSPAAWQPFESVSVEASTPVAAEAASSIEPAVAPAATLELPVVEETPTAEVTRSELPVMAPAAVAAVAASEAPLAAAPQQAETPAWSAAVEEPAKEFASTSFIDKYRHLLEEEDQPTLAPLRGGRPVIDDEFLSPAKVETCASASDESDEALEAYMANMMQRVRSSASLTPPASQAAATEVASSLTTHSLHAASREPERAFPTPTDFLAEEPLSFEDLKQATRKVPLARDLSALREIANSSARGAIATHSQRQTRESAITKIIVAITATISATYLMASAPEITGVQFWIGAATCVVGITAAVQVLIIERKARS